MNWLKAWRTRRLEGYLASHRAELAEWRAKERTTIYAWPSITAKLAGEIARMEKQIEQLRGPK